MATRGSTRLQKVAAEIGIGYACLSFIRKEKKSYEKKWKVDFPVIRAFWRRGEFLSSKYSVTVGKQRVHADKAKRTDDNEALLSSLSLNG